MLSKHSPLPWQIDGSDTTTRMWISDATCKRICTMQANEHDNDRAEFIIRCVNAHDALTARVAELENALIEARSKALHEAAEICDHRASLWKEPYPANNDASVEASICAIRIRGIARAALAKKVTP